MANHYEVKTAVEYEAGGQKKTRWTKVGVAFPLKSGDGFSVVLDAVPVNGKLVIMPPMEKNERGGGDGGGIPF
jgi:hypothetical protein